MAKRHRNGDSSADDRLDPEAFAEMIAVKVAARLAPLLGAPHRAVLWNATQVAAFLNRKPGGVVKAAQRGELPVPAKQRHPWMWNANDWYRWAERRTPLR